MFVRYLFDKGIEDNLLFCKNLELRSTENDIFNVPDSFMKTHHISWKKCISICNDRAKSMTGLINGAVTKKKI